MLESYLNQVIEPYKQFKKTYVVDNTSKREFQGKKLKVKSYVSILQN